MKDSDPLETGMNEVNSKITTVYILREFPGQNTVRDNIDGA